MTLHESGEDYLEAILMLEKEKEKVRSIDIAKLLGFSKPSVSRAVSILKENGYLNVGTSGELILTDTGRETAQRIYERHLLFTELLEKIGVSKEQAAEDACRIEHAMSDESFQHLKEFIESNLNK